MRDFKFRGNSDHHNILKLRNEAFSTLYPRLLFILIFFSFSFSCSTSSCSFLLHVFLPCILLLPPCVLSVSRIIVIFVILPPRIHLPHQCVLHLPLPLCLFFFFVVQYVL